MTRAGPACGSGEPAAFPPDGLPGLDPAWSRVLTITDGAGVPRTFHLLDSWADRFRGTEAAAATTKTPLITLLCVHGNPTWSYLWRRLLSAAPAQWRVIAPDQLGMGYSERPAEPRVLAERVDDLTRLTSALDVTGPVVTVAHDWGGIISLGWAERHRGQVAGIVLNNTAVHQPEESAGPILIRLAHQRPVNLLACRLSPLFVWATTALSRPRLSGDVRAAYAAPYRSAARRRAVSEFVADIPFAAEHPSRPELDRIADGARNITAPTLLLWGPRDPVFREEHLRDLQQRLPHAALHRYEGAGHLLAEDAPEYAAAVKAFVAQLPLLAGDGAGGRHRAPTQPGTGQSATGSSVSSGERSELAELMARDGDPTAAVVEVGGRSISWAELADRVGDTAAGLTAAGVRPGDRVALLVPPSIELTVALYAVWAAGAVIVVVDRGLGLTGMGRALRSARVDHLIADTAGLLASRPMRVPGTRIAVRDVPRPVRRLGRVNHTIAALVRSGRPPGTDHRGTGGGTAADGTGAGLGIGTGIGTGTGTGTGPDDEAAVIFTSGATGPAKGVRYLHRQVRAQLAVIESTYRLTADDRIVAAFAPFALYGPALGIPSAVPGTDVTRPGSLTAAALGDAVVAVTATVVFASPAALTNVLATAADLTEQHRAALGRVRLLMSAGAPVPAGLLRRLAALMPRAELHTPYGMTEGLPLTGISLPEIEDAGDGDGVCVGRPLPDVGLLIGALDHRGVPATELTDRPDVSGEIWVSAAHLKDRYDSRWALEQAAAVHPGWHRTGDVGMIDGGGRLWVQGRTAHVIRTGAGPVTPVGVEQRVQHALSSCDAEAFADPQVAVVGVGPAGTQQVVVVIAGAAGPLASPAITDAARLAAGVPVAAVLRRRTLPVDIRHNSKIDRVAVGGWAERVLAGKRPGR